MKQTIKGWIFIADSAKYDILKNGYFNERHEKKLSDFSHILQKELITYIKIRVIFQAFYQDANKKTCCLNFKF